MTVGMPGKDVKATLHVAVPPVPESVQLVELKVPGPLLLQLTVPVGVIGVPGDVSVTVAVHVVEWKSWIVVGEQLTLVEVVRGNTNTPILLLAASVNQMLPSGPALMPNGPLIGVGTVYSVMLPLVVTFPILPLPTANQKLPSGPPAMPNVGLPGTGNSVK